MVLEYSSSSDSSSWSTIQGEKGNVDLEFYFAREYAKDHFGKGQEKVEV